ncbi:uncharacterized protein LOC143177462 [Calliopsis andreniformis]|uniref:uncharacterized protein LOC143177462 n=1 Tax=Calliopsis andreniformis TaxID=337506 RepID=UPI003FCD2E9C
MGQGRTPESNNCLLKVENGVPNEILNTLVLGEKAVKRHKCTYDGCDAVFNRPSRLARHIRLHTGEKSYKCNHAGCDKAYTNSSHLKRHMETHSLRKKTYKCSVCQLFLSNQDNLKRHYKNKHSNNSKLTCKECNETFAKKYQLATHMSKHTGELHKCDKCNKSFVHIRTFKKHKAAHEVRNKSYPCTVPECNEVFEKWLQLCAHMETHTYACKICGKQLKKRCLKAHSRIHMDNRPVKPCPYEGCGRVYHFESNLTNHIKVKHLEEKYECDICKKTFSSKQKTQEHIHKIHMSERKPRAKKLQRKKRKDAGMPKKSAVSFLLGVDLPHSVEKEIMQRKEDIPYIEQFRINSNDESEIESHKKE